MDDSNKTLALLLVAAIVVSLGGTILSLNKLGQMDIGTVTGKAITNGSANVTITATYTVNVTDRDLTFGAGQLNEAQINCTLISNATTPTPTDCGTWGWTSDKLMIENTGSGTIDVTITSGKTGATLLGGTNPVYQFRCIDNNGGSGTPTTAWTDMATGGATCVQTLLPGSADDEIDVHVKLVIGEGVSSGTKSDILTFSASQG